MDAIAEKVQQALEYRDSVIEQRNAMLTAANARIAKLESALRDLRNYSTAEGRLCGCTEWSIGMARGLGTAWGPRVAVPRHSKSAAEMCELAGEIEKWLHKKCDEALAEAEFPVDDFESQAVRLKRSGEVLSRECSLLSQGYIPTEDDLERLKEAVRQWEECQRL